MTAAVPAPGAGGLRLTQREPRVPPDRLVAELVPPRRFAAERFATYRPSPGQPSQAEALAALERFAAGMHGHVGRRPWWRPPARRSQDGEPPGVYLDGGFGVGKTHLLASLWHAVTAGEPRQAAFGTFVEFTHLVGALGFGPTVEALTRVRLVCVDEFELDDPGDTVLMSRLLRELVDAGVRLAATSNTLPDALGEGRFAAEDFQREIQGLAARFRVVRIDGEDYRHRGSPPAPRPLDDDTVARWALEHDGVSLDAFPDLLDHLARVHPSRYGALLDGVRAVACTGLRPVEDQAVALRLVVLADRMYDRALPFLATGQPIDRLFPEELLRGGYRKKYRRALSRLVALAREGEELVGRSA